MKDSPDITLEEAQMRLLRMLREKDYPYAGRWFRRDDGHIPIYSMALFGMEDVRALMWREGKKWAASLSLGVGDRGEFILAGGLIGRVKRQNWKLMSITNFIPYINDARETLGVWAFQRDRYLNVIAMTKFAHELLKTPGQQKQSIRVMVGIESGVTSEATTAEALSIIQHLYCRTRLDRVITCSVWMEVFK
jgi:hypothetical protein